MLPSPPPRDILGLVYHYLNKSQGRSYSAIQKFFNLPTRNYVAGAIRDIPQTVKDIKMDKQIPNVPNVKLRACVFDIETMNFSAEADVDAMICASFLPLDTEEVYTLSISHEDAISDVRDEHLVHAVIEELRHYDILIGHNIAGYDLNWLTTRMLYYDIPFPRSVFYYDTYSASKRMGIKTRKSLGNLGAFFGIDQEKTLIYRTNWARVLSPDPQKHAEAMAEILYHCEEDVKMNRKLFNILWATDNRIRNLPYYDRWN